MELYASHHESKAAAAEDTVRQPCMDVAAARETAVFALRTTHVCGEPGAAAIGAAFTAVQALPAARESA